MQHFVTEGLWITLPARPRSPDERQLPRLPGALHAIEHALIALLPCWPCATAGTSAASPPPCTTRPSCPPSSSTTGTPAGSASPGRGSPRFDQWLRDTRALIRDCPCESGCPSCIQSPKCGNWNEPLDKELALALLDRILEQAPSLRT